jgi:hypothetical protein
LVFKVSSKEAVWLTFYATKKMKKQFPQGWETADLEVSSAMSDWVSNVRNGKPTKDHCKAVTKVMIN